MMGPVFVRIRVRHRSLVGSRNRCSPKRRVRSAGSASRTIGATMSCPPRRATPRRAQSARRCGSSCTSPSTITPQWPCDVYWQRQTSVMSGARGRRPERTERELDDPVVLLRLGRRLVLLRGDPEQDHGLDAEPDGQSTSRTSSSTVWRAMPRRSSFPSDSGATKSGITNWSRLRRVSRTRARSVGFRRKRRSRTSGKSTSLKEDARGDRAWRKRGSTLPVPPALLDFGWSSRRSQGSAVPRPGARRHCLGGGLQLAPGRDPDRVRARPAPRGGRTGRATLRTRTGIVRVRLRGRGIGHDPAHRSVATPRGGRAGEIACTSL